MQFRPDIAGCKCSWISEFVPDYNGENVKIFCFFGQCSVIYEPVCFQKGSVSKFHWEFSSKVPVAFQDLGYVLEVFVNEEL